jgi:polyisoprenyl-teichoic acid--peptidoglycan teichoic acid transferase
MAQAQPRRRPIRPAPVSDLERRRRSAPPPPPESPDGGNKRQPLSGRSLLVGFCCGLGLGYALAGPLPKLLASGLGSLQHAAPALRSLVDPLGVEQRRILVMGTDQISGSTDVMFIVQVKDGTTRITQVPRDTFIESEAFGILKANALYAVGGVNEVKQELSSLLSEKIDRYLIINIEAVQNLAEAIGGVEIDVPKRMYYVDGRQDLYIDLLPGPQLLKGKDLEGFLRYRNDELGDLGRMERQQLVLQEVFSTIAQPGTVTKLPSLLAIAGKDIHTDLSPVELGALLTAMGTTKLSTKRLGGRLYWHGDLSYWMPDLNTRHAGEQSPEPSP